MRMGAFTFSSASLYQKAGDKKAAEEAFKESKRIRSQWDESARVALEPSSTGLSNR